MGKEIERIPTGIPGLDRLIEGGFVKYGVALLSGGAGSGKSIFALQYIYNGAVQYNQKGLFISFEEKIDNLKKDAAVFGWDFDNLEKKGKIKFMYLSPYNSTGLLTAINNEISAFKPERVAIDSLSILGLALKDGFGMRRHLFSIADLLQFLKCTSVLTSEVAGEASLDVSSGETLSRFGMEEFLSDTVITLHNSGLGGESDRALRVVKMRRTNHMKGPVPMKIGDDGIKILGKEKGYR